MVESPMSNLGKDGALCNNPPPPSLRCPNMAWGVEQHGWVQEHVYVPQNLVSCNYFVLYLWKNVCITLSRATFGTCIDPWGHSHVPRIIMDAPWRMIVWVTILRVGAQVSLLSNTTIDSTYLVSKYRCTPLITTSNGSWFTQLYLLPWLI